MKSKAIVPLAIGLIVGIFAVHRGLNYIKSVKGAAKPVSTVAVVTATMEIPQGVAVSENMVSVTQVPKSLAPARHFSEVGEVVDRVSCMMVPKDMPVMPTMLAPKGTAPGLGSKIPDGMRAVAVRVDEWSAVGGWLKPGVHVDVAAVFSVKSGRSNKTVSKIILQNIEVAAVGGTMGRDPQDTGQTIARSVTLIVKPKDVAKLHLASSKGKIQLAMRNSLDEDSERAATSDEDQLFGEGGTAGKNQQNWSSAIGGFLKQAFGLDRSQEPVQLAEAPRRCTVDLINGARHERRVYIGRDSMEQVGMDGTNQSLLNAQARPYARRASGRPAASTDGGGAEFDGGAMSQGE